MNIAKFKSNKNRRPLTTRNHRWARQFSTTLNRRGVEPNHISLASLVFAVIGFLLLWLSSDAQIRWLPPLYVAVALCCQLRLLCNLMDGMVAMESTIQSPAGVIWNELPDRFSDALFFVGVGYAVNELTLAWAVTALAMLVSYVREFGHGVDGTMDYSGPMGKPQRMALLTLALLAASIVAAFAELEETIYSVSSVLSSCLWFVVFGCIVTLIRRIYRLARRINS